MGDNPGQKQTDPTETPTVVEVASAASFHALTRAWDELAAADPAAQLYQESPWLLSWMAQGPQSGTYILAVRRGPRLTAGLPLQAYEMGCGPLRLRKLRFLADTHSDYCDALVDPRHPEDLELLWGHLMAARNWHVLDLRYVPKSSRLVGLAYETKSAGQGMLWSEEDEIAPFLDIQHDWRETASRNLRDNITRRLRRLRALGTVAHEVAQDGAQVDQFLEQLAEMHIARWQSRGQTSVFCLPGHRAWLRSVCLELLRRNQLYLCRLSANGDPVTVGLYFLHHRRVIAYVGAFAEAYAKFGPTHLLDAGVFDDARARQLADVADLGRGNEPYKLQWTDRAQTLLRLVIGRRSPVGVPLYWWGTRVKPALWRHPNAGKWARELRRRLAMRRGDAGPQPEEGSD